MDTLNRLLTSVADLLLVPFCNDPATGLVACSVVTGVVMSYVFGKTSNQRALRNAADNIRAQLFAIKLFKEDLYVTFLCQLALLRSTAVRLLHSIPPMIVMIVPLFVVLAQLAMRYEHRPLVKGDQVVVIMHVKPDHWKEVRNAKLSSGDGFVVETEGLRDEKTATIYWRIRAEGKESVSLRWQLGDESVSKALPISASQHQLLTASPKRPGNSIWDRLFYPTEPGLPATSPVNSIDIQLGPRVTPIFGWGIPWWVTYFLVSMLVAFIAGKLMGVQY